MSEPAPAPTAAAPAPEQPRTEPGRETIRERIAYWQYASLERVAMRWPERIGRRLFAAYGALGHRLMPGVRATVAANMAQVLGLPPDDELVAATTREAFSLYARYWYDTFRARVMTKREIDRGFQVEGLQHIDQALEAGTGAILALPHLGNWDVGGRFLTVNGYRLCAVAEELKPRRVYELFLRHREELGMLIVPYGGDRRVGTELARLLADNWSIALVADRDLSGRGVDVEMFGATRKLPAGPALLSLLTGAPLLPAGMWTLDEGWRCIIGPPLEIDRSGDTRTDVATLTRALAVDFERSIAAKPADWHMFQPAFTGP